MIHLPPPIPTPGRLLPVRRRVLPARAPRLWLPRWRLPDARAMAWGFKNGVPLFRAGKWCYEGCCPSCGCADLYATPGVCTFCGSCTPRQVQMVLSGVTTNCSATGFGVGSDWNGATLAASVLLTNDGSGCQWTRSESPGSTFNNRTFTGATTGPSTCAGTLTANNHDLLFVVRIENVSGTNYVRARLQGALVPFAGRVAFTDCFSTYTINNNTDPGTGSPQSGSGGSATITFCP